jgi:hypothetical protein
VPQVVFIDPRSRVADLDRCFVGLSFRRQQQRAPIGHRAQCVYDEVGDDLSNADRINIHLREIPVMILNPRVDLFTGMRQAMPLLELLGAALLLWFFAATGPPAASRRAARGAHFVVAPEESAEGTEENHDQEDLAEDEEGNKDEQAGTQRSHSTCQDGAEGDQAGVSGRTGTSCTPSVDAGGHVLSPMRRQCERGTESFARCWVVASDTGAPMEYPAASWPAGGRRCSTPRPVAATGTVRGSDSRRAWCGRGPGW